MNWKQAAGEEGGRERGREMFQPVGARREAERSSERGSGSSWRSDRSELERKRQWRDSSDCVCVFESAMHSSIVRGDWDREILRCS